GLNCIVYKELMKSVRVLLNQLSKADLGLERYKSEIRQIIDVLEKVKALHATSNYRTIIAGGELVQIRLHNPVSDQIFVGEYELSNSLYLLTYLGSHYYSSFKGKIVKCFPINPDGTIPQEHTLNGNSKEMLTNYNEFQALHALTATANWGDSLFRIDGSKLI
ncbi:MAG: hypothetical protein ACTHMC_29360, partial [Pseudobacter sp.]|uniref:hypothetical protein n=1 Tax=Pseudobacter sp. TaxID=2045420 RepID=UPI003F7F4265